MGNMAKGKIVLYLMRHGQTVLNKAVKTQGWCDGELTDEGIETAINVGFGLSDINFKAVYSSDLGRAVRTAQIVINENKASLKLQLEKLEGLREVHFGKYEGKPYEQMVNDALTYLNVNSFKEGEEKYDFQKEYFNACAKMDETRETEDYDTVVKRVMESLNYICEKTIDENAENVLVVVHGGMLKIIIDYLDNKFDVTTMDNSSISKVIYEDGVFRVQSVNDNSYSKRGKFIRNNLCCNSSN